MGWVIAIVLAVLVLLGLYLSRRVNGASLQLCAALVLVALAGYAWQGSPDMAGHPVSSGGR